MKTKKERAYDFYKEMTDQGIEISKIGEWIQLTPPPTDVRHVMTLSELGDEIVEIINEIEELSQ